MVSLHSNRTVTNSTSLAEIVGLCRHSYAVSTVLGTEPTHCETVSPEKQVLYHLVMLWPQECCLLSL